MIIEKNTISYTYENIYSLTERKIGIPIFQRFYDWKKDQTKQLLADIEETISNKEKDLYLLDFIYYDENEKMMLADGQQRIVTLNLLYKAINDFISENKISIEKLKLFDIEYDITENQNKYFCTFNNYVCKPFKTVYLFLKEWVDENSGILNDVIEVLKNNVTVYLKKCLNADDAFVIFQQINTGGKPLSKDEIIQTALKQYSAIYKTPITCKIKDMKLALISYYKYLTGDTSKNLDNISIISFLKSNVTKNKVLFDKFVNTLSTLSNLETNPITSVFCWINRTSLYDVLNVLAMKRIDTKINKNYLEKVVLPLCMLSIELSLTGGLPSLLKSLMNDVIDMINDGKNENDISLYIASYINNNASSCKMNYTEFVKSIGGQGNSTPGIKKALLLIDVIISNTSGTINVSKINLEHIYPQTPKIDWAAMGWPTSKDDQKIIINNIGNQFLLCESVNKSISNSYITSKKSKYIKVVAKDAILRTEMNTVDFDKFETEKEKYIELRQNEIAKNIYNNFPFAKVILNNDTGKSI